MSSSTLREVIARAIYEEPSKYGTPQESRWDNLGSQFREGWMRDADRVIEAIANHPEFPDSSSKARMSNASKIAAVKDAEALMVWCRSLAHYFEKRPTNGEDRSHWANFYNAENARNVEAILRRFVDQSLSVAP